MMKETILTGVRANEEPTIANYLGAFIPMVNMQKKYADTHNINMFVPDLHSFTTPINHKGLYQKVLQNVRYYMAAGIDFQHDNVFIYRQSFIPAHSELTWILDCFTSVGEMMRMTQFKDKSSGSGEGVSMGLMNYPVLMAADILLYHAKYIPVGEDQFQHIEITRDIAERFNRKFGPVFTVPDTTAKQTAFIERDSGLRVRSLTDPTKKMSKSTEDPKSKILLSDSPDQAAKKIISATTDSLSEINFDWQNQPGVTSLLQMLSILTGEPQDSVTERWEGKERYGELKREVATAVHDFLSDFQAKTANYPDARVEEVLVQSEDHVRPIADATLLAVQQAVGLRPKNNET